MATGNSTMILPDGTILRGGVPRSPLKRKAEEPIGAVHIVEPAEKKAKPGSEGKDEKNELEALEVPIDESQSEDPACCSPCPNDVEFCSERCPFGRFVRTTHQDEAKKKKKECKPCFASAKDCEPGCPVGDRLRGDAEFRFWAKRRCEGYTCEYRPRATTVWATVENEGTDDESLDYVLLCGKCSYTKYGGRKIATLIQ